MSRVRKRLYDLKKDSPEYWDEILRREGLSMKAGTTSKLSYAGNSTDLEYIEGANSTNNGQVAPKDKAE